MSDQSQKLRGSFALLPAASALADTALKERPGGSISPFCEPPTVTSTPHSSWRYSIEASDEIVSTISRAGCLAASMALRTAAMLETQPVEVSLWTTQTALIACALSALSRASIWPASAPRRQSLAMNSGWSPSLVAMFFQSVAKCPVSYISTRSPGESVLTSAASHAPVPDEG